MSGLESNVTSVSGTRGRSEARNRGGRKAKYQEVKKRKVGLYIVDYTENIALCSRAFLSLLPSYK